MRRLLIVLAFVLGLSAPAWAATPAVVGTPTESTQSSDDTSPFTISRPAGVSGQLTIVILEVDGTPTLGWPAGYTSIIDDDHSGGDFKVAVAYHLEDGTEGTTFDVTSTAAEKWSAIVYSISGAETPATQAPEAASAEEAGTLTPDGGPNLTPTGGAKDYLWISAVANNGEEADDDTWGNTSPTNFTPSPPRQITSGTGGLPGTNTALESSERALNAASENPGTYNNDSSKTAVGVTIAIHPTSGGPPPCTPTLTLLGVGRCG